ncbi:MAG TPA: BMP family ABC transporter substrate-binding protein [Anaeromyxobacter sp.]|nr:BMP family ABC transporter substrate-binding protein [Anaeromyxobacter sp.]
MTTRSLLNTLAAGALLASTVLFGCSKKEEPKPEPAAAPAPAPEPPKPEPLKAAWIYVGPVGDAGWTFAHDLGRKGVEAKFGDKVKTSYVENVPEGADAERVIRDLVAQGNKIIFATSFGFMDSMVKVAKDFPDVYFEHATGYQTSPNLRVYEGRFYEPAYLAGIVAGGMTKTNTLGFVASVPIPEVLRNINAFTLGAQSVNPKVKTKLVWINAWFDPPKETEAAQALINQGADVLLQNTDSTAVLQTAEKNGKYAFGWDSDMSAFAPKAHLGSCLLHWDVYYTKAIGDVLDKTWKTDMVKLGIKEGGNDFVKMSDAIPENIRKKVEEAKQYLIDHPGEVYRGPIKDQSGKEVLAKGQVADEKMKAEMNFLVKGVEGKIPTSK